MASDGKWYPPELHPDATAEPTPSAERGGLHLVAPLEEEPPDDELTVAADDETADFDEHFGEHAMVPDHSLAADLVEDDDGEPPHPGWWIATDGHWYPPELHPDAQLSDDAASRGDDAADDSLGEFGEELQTGEAAPGPVGTDPDPGELPVFFAAEPLIATAHEPALGTVPQPGESEPVDYFGAPPDYPAEEPAGEGLTATTAAGYAEPEPRPPRSSGWDEFQGADEGASQVHDETLPGGPFGVDPMFGGPWQGPEIRMGFRRLISAGPIPVKPVDGRKGLRRFLRD